MHPRLIQYLIAFLFAHLSVDVVQAQKADTRPIASATPGLPTNQYCYVVSTIVAAMTRPSTSSSAQNLVIQTIGPTTTPAVSSISPSSSSLSSLSVFTTSNAPALTSIAPIVAAVVASATSAAPVPAITTTATTTQNSAALRLRTPILIHLASGLVGYARAYLTTVGSVVYSCVPPAVTTPAVTTPLPVAPSSTSRKVIASTSSAAPQGGAAGSSGSSGSGGTGGSSGSSGSGGASGGSSSTGSCINDLDCLASPLSYCRSGTCAIGECNYDGDCGSHSRCSRHVCERCIKGALGIYIC